MAERILSRRVTQQCYNVHSPRGEENVNDFCSSQAPGEETEKQSDLRVLSYVLCGVFIFIVSQMF